MLLSKAEEDWRGQLRALRHAEYLIRAAPDELPAYAGDVGQGLWLSSAHFFASFAPRISSVWQSGTNLGQGSLVRPPTRTHACTVPSLCGSLFPPSAKQPSACTVPAVPLARALVHTKVPPWMDQEMPEGGPSANTQRFRCGQRVFMYRLLKADSRLTACKSIRSA